MSVLGSKTPVSCLQEYLVSKKMIPHYELTHNGVGTHKPEFTFRVQVGGLWEEGTGRSKQEAKHRAAEKMLRSLKISDYTEENEEISDFSTEPAENFVGQLKEFCINVHYPEPKYHLEESSGPPHRRIFKMVCAVSKLEEFGISTTIKKAKQEAASRMFQRLKEVSDKPVTVNSESVSEENLLPSPRKIVTSTLTDDEIFEKYNALRASNPTAEKDPAALYKDNHNAYIKLPELSPTLSKVLQQNKLETALECALQIVTNIAEELHADLHAIEIPTKSAPLKFTILTLCVAPPAAGVGHDEKNAAFNLLNSLLILCSNQPLL